MKYFETKHERNSAKLTTLITIILILLLFIVGAPYMDPPIEYGVVVNFGTTDFGKGDVQPLKPIKSEPKEVNEPYQPEVSKTEPPKAAEANEEVLTQENEEAIAIKKQKQAEAKAKAIADAKAKAEADRIAKEKAEQEAKKKKLDALIGGVSKSDGTATGGEGNDNKAGDKGQLNGDPYAPSYFGDSGTGSAGVGYGLNGRGTPRYKPIIPPCNEEGFVVIRIEVNRTGKVVNADLDLKETNNTAPCLVETAKKIAYTYKWPQNDKAPVRQIGWVKVDFSLGQ